MPEHHPHPLSPYEHLLRGVSGVDLYRGHIPLAFDPASIPRGIPLDAGDCQGTGAPIVSAPRSSFVGEAEAQSWGGLRGPPGELAGGVVGSA